MKNKGASTTIRNQAGELPSDMIPPVVPLLVSSFPRWEFNKRMATNSSISAKTVQNTCKPGHDKYANGEEVKQNLFKLPDKKIYWPDSGSNKRVRPAVESSSDNNSVAITDQYIYESEAKRVKLAPQHELANQLSLEIPSQDDLQTEIPGFQ